MGGLTASGRFLPFGRTLRAVLKAEARGFTIVEVMIVLAVSGALFVAAAILVNGKQNQAGFNQAIQQIQSQIRQIMSEVSTGYFPNNANFQCTAGSGGPVQLSAASPNGQGANAGCIFAGKVMQFKVSGTDPEQYAVYTLAGAQKNAAGNESVSLAEAAPKAVAPGAASPSGFPDITVTSVLQNGLITSAAPPAGMWYNNGSVDVNVGAVAFVPSFAQYATQQLSVVPVSTSALGAATVATVDTINSKLTTSVIDPSQGVFICFASGGTNQSGLVTIGGSGHPTSVTLKIFEGSKTCGR